MTAYIYDDNFEFKCEEKPIPGITFVNSTSKAPDLEKYPQDKYRIVFNKELDEWEYELLPKEDANTEPEIDQEVADKLTQLYKLKDKYANYYGAEMTARLLKLPQNLTTKRLAMKDKIEELEAKITELTTSQDKTEGIKDGQN